MYRVGEESEEARRRHSNPLELQKQAAIWAAMRVLGTQPRSSSEAAGALNHWDTAPAVARVHLLFKVGECN